MASVLVIEDDKTFSRIVEGFLTKNNYSVHVSAKGKEGLEAFAEKAFDLVLLDYRLPDMTGMDVLEAIREKAPQIPVIIMTGFNDIKTAVRAIKAGAYEFITKPVNPDELIMLLKEALKKPVKSVVVTSKGGAAPSSNFVKGNSDESKQLHEYIRLVAPTNMSVIIEGESGTGKEYVARSIHAASNRASEAFVAVDCGALSKELANSELFGHIKGAFTGAVQDKTGQFESANRGTLFLDEVGNLSYDVQVKLLRAIQERIIQPIGSNREIKIDVRIITATNDELTESIKLGSFREDLYHRINEFKIQVPPLRQREADLIEFITFFRSQANQELDRTTTGFDDEVMQLFKTYSWPGNLRELKNVVKRAVLLSTGDLIGKDTLPVEMLESIRVAPTTANTAPIYDLKALQETQERELIMKTLQEVKYNKSKAARILNIDRKTLYLKMEKYGID